jgi:hypothetical protein
MAKTTDLQQLIDQEFSCYYMSDELPAAWDESFMEKELPKMARRSAVRLKHELKGENPQELIELLVTASQDPNHSMVQMICDATLIDWPEEPEDWSVLQKLLNQIAMNLKQLSAA